MEPVWLRINEVELPLERCDPRLDGLRILHLTDFHLSGRVPASHIRHAIEIGQRLGCDLVALTGDFVHAGFKQVQSIARLVGRLKAPLGVYAVLGNHDYSVRDVRGVRRYPTLHRAVEKSLVDVGIRVLHNEHVQVSYQGAPVAVAGVADAWSRESDLESALKGIDDKVIRIVLAHNPVALEDLGERRCDLMLSGHTHGGQIRLAKIGQPMLSKRMRNYAGGLFRHGSGYLYVNHGVGYTLRFRYNVRPEVAVLRIRSAKLDADDASRGEE